MAFTLEQLQDLDDAIASGALEVTYMGKTVRYDSFEAMIKRRAFIASKLGIEEETHNGTRVYPTFSNGLRSSCD